ncbi:hypothetical protein D027_2376B, partial [Vibrio parahaemolyticus 861]|jgi:hypothetical protein
LRQ